MATQALSDLLRQNTAYAERPISNIIRTNGLVTGYSVGSVNVTITYDSLSRPVTISDGVRTQTVTYGADGNITALG